MKNFFTNRRIILLFSLMPAVFLGFYLLNRGVNMPFRDQWELVPIIKHANEGNLGFHDFGQQHNEHRIFFPRVLMITSAFLTKWDIRAELFISLGLATASFVMLLKALDATQKNAKLNFLKWTILVLGLIWFSFTQFENWLWGWQIQWFLNVFGVMLVIWATSRTKKIDIPSLIIAMSGAAIAQYSLGNGLLIWPILILGLHYKGVSKKSLAIVASGALISTAVYYFNYVVPSVDPSKTFSLRGVIKFLAYIAIYLGRSLSYWPKLAALLGAGLLLLFTAGLTYLFIKKPRRFKAMLPWTMLGAYAILSAFVTGFSRYGFGLMQAHSSRYTTISSLLLISTVVIVIFNRDLIQQRFKKIYRPLAVIAPAVLLGLVITNSLWGYHKAEEHTRHLRFIKTCTSVHQPDEACLLATYPYQSIVESRLKYLKQIHWGGY